jgi:hypothetical protein
VVSVQGVHAFLRQLSQTGLHKDQEALFAALLPRCSAREVKWLVRIIQKDLKLFLGPKVALAALHPQAYAGAHTARHLIGSH